MDKNQSLAKISQLIGETYDFGDGDPKSPLLAKWRRDVELALKHIFGNSSEHIKDFKKIKFLPPPAKPEANFISRRENEKRAILYDLAKAKALLESMFDEISDYWSDRQTTPLLSEVNFSVIWHLIHPSIVNVSKRLFDDSHFADSVLAAMREVNLTLKAKVKALTGVEYDGANLMQKTFSSQNPILVLGDLGTQIGKDLQLGYQQIFTGSIIGIRNPKAHDNIHIDDNRAFHLLFLASLLMHKIDEARIP